MAYLLYGILKAPAFRDASLTGVKGKPVFFVTAHGLDAAVSELAAGEQVLPVPELLAYGRVVDALYRRQAVVPMRCGCILDGLPEIHNVLAEKKQHYDVLLQQLEGCAEMGLRILPPMHVAPAEPDTPPADGSGYLARRRAHYQMNEEAGRQHQALMEHYVRAFAGLYNQQRSETTTKDGTVILSLYFLIPATQIARFRETFERVVETSAAKALLSGPWPPYNFVTPEVAGTGDR